MSVATLHTFIAALDLEVFDSCNRSDVERFVPFFNPALEFDHHQTGLAVDSEKLAKRLRENIRGKVTR